MEGEGEVDHDGSQWQPEDGDGKHGCKGGVRRRNRPGKVREREGGCGSAGWTSRRWREVDCVAASDDTVAIGVDREEGRVECGGKIRASSIF